MYAQCVNSAYTVHNSKICPPKSTNAGKKKKSRKREGKTWTRSPNASYVTVWLALKHAFSTSTFSFFFFFLCVNSNPTWVHYSHTVYHCSCTVYVLKNIKKESHDTIYTFKNYFTTIFSVFSFQFSATINLIHTHPIYISPHVLSIVTLPLLSIIITPSLTFVVSSALSS